MQGYIVAIQLHCSASGHPPRKLRLFAFLAPASSSLLCCRCRDDHHCCPSIGEFFYPKPINDFEASKYVRPWPGGSSRSTWYQWAASDQPFLTGCRCVYVRYGTNENGTVSVENSCTRGNRTTGIRGYTTATPNYGNGSFQVAFFGQAPEQPGPNYIVTRAFVNRPGKDKVRAEDTEDADDVDDQQDDGNDEGADSRDEGLEDRDSQTVVVGSQNFTGWFLLSRTRNVEQQVIQEYLREVADVGFNLTRPYAIYDQDNCGAEPPYDPRA